jgi:hypothetical protein
MATGRELVSRVRSVNKLFNTDNLLTDRAILAEIRQTSNLFIKRETNLRKLWATDTIFTPIPCLELEEVPISECCEYVDECTVAKSKHKLPQLAEGNYQYVIQGVWSINALSGKGIKIKEITVNRYLNLLKLPIIKNEIYYWVIDNYLYITNPSIKAVRLSAFFEEFVSNDIMFSDCGCGKEYPIDEICKNPLDKKFPLPGYLEKQVIDTVCDKLLKTYYNLKSDMTTDGVDGQTPNSKPTN